MQINNNNQALRSSQTPTFKAIRIVKAKPEQFASFAENFKDFCNKNWVFRAESFHHSIFYDSLVKTAQSENQPISWIMKNAENHGLLNSEKLKDLPMIVLTDKDIKKFKFNSAKDIFSLLIFSLKNGSKLAKEGYPKHLISAKNFKDFADKKLSAFNRFIEKNHGKRVTFEEFIQEIADKKI